MERDDDALGSSPRAYKAEIAGFMMLGPGDDDLRLRGPSGLMPAVPAGCGRCSSTISVVTPPGSCVPTEPGRKRDGRGPMGDRRSLGEAVALQELEVEAKLEVLLWAMTMGNASPPLTGRRMDLKSSGESRP